MFKKFSSGALIFGVSSSLVCQGLGNQDKVNNDDTFTESDSLLSSSAQVLDLKNQGVGKDAVVVSSGLQESASKGEQNNSQSSDSASAPGCEGHAGEPDASKGILDVTGAKGTPVQSGNSVLPDGEKEQIKWEDIYRGEKSDIFFRWLCSKEKIKDTWLAELYWNLFHTYKGDPWRKPKKLMAFVLWVSRYQHFVFAFVCLLLGLLLSMLVGKLALIYCFAGSILCVMVPNFAILQLASSICQLLLLRSNERSDNNRENLFRNFVNLS